MSRRVHENRYIGSFNAPCSIPLGSFFTPVLGAIAFTLFVTCSRSRANLIVSLRRSQSGFASEEETQDTRKKMENKNIRFIRNPAPGRIKGAPPAMASRYDVRVFKWCILACQKLHDAKISQGRRHFSVFPLFTGLFSSPAVPSYIASCKHPEMKRERANKCRLIPTQGKTTCS